MSFYSDKKVSCIFHTIIILAFFIFLIPLNSVFSAIDTQDAVTQANTNAMVNNSNQIIAILSGTQPGAQYDAIRTQQQLVEVKLLLRNLTNNIVNWVNTGFEGGNPAFVTNMYNKTNNVTNVTVNNFVTEDTALDSACEPFRTPIKQAIGLSYGTFESQVQCAYDSTIPMETFLNGDDFSWDAWLQVTTVPQNNIMGMMLIAQNELDNRITANQEELRLEATWGNGFLSWKDCSGGTGQTDLIFGNPDCVIKTPGSVIANKLMWADTSSLRELELADDFNTVTYALSQKTNYSNLRSLSVANGGLLGTNEPPQDTPAQINAAYNNLMSYIGTLPPPNGGGQGGGSVNANAALAAIDAQFNLELAYYNIQSNTIDRLLEVTKNAFSSSACVATLVNGVVSQIMGNYTGAKELIWNKTDISSTTITISHNLTSLTTARTAVETAISLNQGDTVILQIISGIMNLPNLSTNALIENFSPTGPVTNTFNAIKNWIQGKITTASASCTINTTMLTEWGIQ